jgi:transposase
MNAYSLDLRKRVIAMVQEDKASQAAVAEHFQVSIATVENWWRLWRETRSVAPLPFSGGAPRALKACEAVIRAAVQQQPDVTLQELCDYVQAQTGVRASPSMMCRELHILKLPRKKVTARQPTRHAARTSASPRLSSNRHPTVASARRPSQIHR